MYEKSQKRQIVKGVLRSQVDLISYNLKKDWQVLTLSLIVGLLIGWAI